MLQHLAEEVIFENHAGDTVTLQTTGIEAFKEQAEAATSYFQTRQQTIEEWQIEDNQITVQISYEAILAIDLPNGLKAGETLRLTGQSIFSFQEGKIIKIVDKS